MHPRPDVAVLSAPQRPRRGSAVAVLAALNIGLLLLTAAGCGGGKATPPAPVRAGSGGSSGSGTGGKASSSGTGGSQSGSQGGSAAGGSGAGGSVGGGQGGANGADALDTGPADTGADAEPVDLGPPPVTCGNGTKDPGEDCDKGAENEANPYGKDKCTKACKIAPFCGDGTENKGAGQGEECDKGAANADKAYGSKGDCSATCKLVPQCGDKKVQDPERCDEGDDKEPTAGKTGCKACQIVAALANCGDGKREGTEACDNGNANIEGDYAAKPAVPPAVICNKQCKVVTKFCGDGKTDGGEQCDKGPAGEAAMPGKPGCSADCRTTTVAAQCGDGVKNVIGEECDQGAKNRNNDAPYVGNEKPSPYIDPVTGKPALFCSRSCKDVHYCGDGSMQVTEECDLGQGNDANAYGEGKCTAVCTKAPFCGDNKVAANEKCDSGPANIDPATPYVAGATDPNKPPCRRGLCTIVPFCGDGAISNNEKCDNGKTNVTTDYVGGTSPSGQKPPCRAGTCVLVPYCGDGVITNGEPCDPETADAKQKKNCTSDCKKIEAAAKELKVTGISGDVLGCAGAADNAKCITNANTPGGDVVQVACTAAGETELVFGALGGRPEGDVALTLDGIPGTATVTCDAGVRAPVTDRAKLPEGCWTNNRSIKVQIKSGANTCLGLQYAVVKARVFPN